MTADLEAEDTRANLRAEEFDRNWIRGHVAEERRQAALLGDIREAIFGIQDGLVSTVGVVTAVAVASDDRFLILVAGIVTAVVTAPSGESLLLVYEDGAWRVDGSAIDLYGQSTPESALRSFVRAFRNRRYDVLLRFIPDAEREGLGAAELKRAWEGGERAELERLVSAVETALPTARLEVTGDRATMAFGAAGTVELVREKGAWKVEDLK